MARVMVACEFSGTVRDAFARLGHDAWSCDLLPGRGNHIQASAWGLDFSGFDLLIGHPPCTYFSLVANGLGGAYVNSPLRVRKRRRGLDFVKFLWEAPVAFVALENPVGRLSSMWRRPTQIVHPWQHGYPVTKATCLWLRDLPKIVPRQVVKPRYAWVPSGKLEDHNRQASLDRLIQEIHGAHVERDVWAKRSLTFPAIATAMAEQWGAYVDIQLSKKVRVA